MKILSKNNEKKLLLVICCLLSVLLIVAVWQLFSIKKRYQELIELIITHSEEPTDLIEIPVALPELEKGFSIFGPYESLTLALFSKNKLGFVYQEDGKFFINFNDVTQTVLTGIGG